MLRSAWTRTALCLLLIGGSAAPIQAAAAAPDGEIDTTCQDGWRHVSVPKGAQASRPYEVVTHEGRLAWLLGGSDGSPLILRRTANGWRSVKAVPDDAEADAPVALLDASVRADGSLWTAGYVRPRRGVMEPYAGIIKGRRWRDRSDTDPLEARVALAGIAAKGEERAWAVGTRLADGRTRAHALRWDGEDWEQRDPRLQARESGLTAVATTPSGKVWTVGWASNAAGSKRPLVLRLEGGDWTRVKVTGLPAGSAVLTDVVFTGNQSAWASGFTVAAGSSLHRPFVARWEGETWAATVVPFSEGVSGIPRSIAVSDDGAVWLAGTWLPLDAGDPRAFVAHSPDGTAESWSVLRDLPVAGGRAEAHSIASAGSTAYVSGHAGGKAFLLERCEHTEDPVGAATMDGPASLVTASAALVAQTGPSVVTTPGAWTTVAAERRLPAPVRASGFKLRDVSKRVGLDLEVHTLAGMAADLDADDYDDLLIWSHGDVPHLLMGGPDGFSERADSAFTKVDRHQCSSADVDADGALDVFCSVGRARGSAIDRHELTLRAGLADGSNAADLLGLEDPFGRGRAATFIDVDRDGRPDLFVANSPDRGDAMPGTNRFFRNVEGRFVAAPELRLDTSVGGWCAVAADIDADGDEDLLVCQELSDDKREPGLRVHVNDDGALSERSKRLGLQPIEDIDVVVADMNGDRRPDIVQLSRTRLRISRGNRAGDFVPVFEALTPRATGMAVGDVDGDGSLDIYVVAGSSDRNEDDLLLVNGGKARSFTSVRIPQAKTGSGADVLAIDHDHNGLSDFVVLDGRGSLVGPVRLLASYPAR